MTLKWYGDDFLKQLRDETPDGLFEVAETFIEAAANRAPVDDGDLRNSAYVVSDTKSTYKSAKNHRKEIKPAKGAVGAGFAIFYARMAEYGTKPHKVPKKKNKVLRLASGDIVRGPIPHPGMAAKPFMRPTLDEMQDKLGSKVADSIRKRLK